MSARLICGSAAAAAWIALAGCGASQAPQRPSTPSNLAQAQTTHEYPSPPPQRVSTIPTAEPPNGRSAGTTVATNQDSAAVQEIRAFAELYINWDAQSVAAHMQALAAASVGQARSAMQLAAAQTSQDYELQRGGIANHGTVEAVAPLAGRGGRFVVVTLERTTATNTTAYDGLRAAWHVTIATVAAVGAGQLVLSGWQPES